MELTIFLFNFILRSVTNITLAKSRPTPLKDVNVPLENPTNCRNKNLSPPIRGMNASLDITIRGGEIRPFASGDNKEAKRRQLNTAGPQLFFTDTMFGGEIILDLVYFSSASCSLPTTQTPPQAAGEKGDGRLDVWMYGLMDEWMMDCVKIRHYRYEGGRAKVERHS